MGILTSRSRPGAGRAASGAALLIALCCAPIGAALAQTAAAVPNSLTPQVKKYCLGNEQQYETTGLTRPQYAAFCDCYAVTMAKGATEAEMDFQRRNKHPSAAYQELANATLTRCKPK
jgi:hypothetical protein